MKTNRDRIRNWQIYSLEIGKPIRYQNGEFYHEMINLINIRKNTEDLKNKILEIE